MDQVKVSCKPDLPHRLRGLFGAAASHLLHPCCDLKPSGNEALQFLQCSFPAPGAHSSSCQRMGITEWQDFNSLEVSCSWRVIYLSVDLKRSPFLPHAQECLSDFGAQRAAKARVASAGGTTRMLPEVMSSRRSLEVKVYNRLLLV